MMCVCAHMCVCAGFHVSDASFNYEEAAMYCESKSSTLASIYTAEELAEARAAIKAKGIDKAITSAFADGTGWKWREKTEYWKYDEFPLNTGKVTDMADPKGWSEGMYSLHGDGDFIWDADGREEKHPALCRIKKATPPPDDGCVDDPMGYVAADSSKSCDMVDAQGGWWACESLDPDFNGVKNIYVWELCPKSCKKCPTGAMSTFYLSASFSLRKHPRLLFLHAPRDPFCICSRLSGSNLCDVCVCTYVCVYTSGTLCLSVFSIHLRVNAAFYHPALTVESTTGCSSAADCDCPTEGGWWPGWCDQGNCWYVRPSSLEFSFPLSLVRATVTRYPLFEIMR